jgi:hypothetical protein
MIPEQLRHENSLPQCNWSLLKKEFPALENVNFREILGWDVRIRAQR